MESDKKLKKRKAYLVDNNGMIKKDDLQIYFPKVFKMLEKAKNKENYYVKTNVKISKFLDSELLVSINHHPLYYNEKYHLEIVYHNIDDSSKTERINYTEFEPMLLSKAKKIGVLTALKHINET